MKKVLILLAICALAVPAFAGEVTFSAVDDGADVNIVMTVVADEGDGPVGVGLDVAVDAELDLTAAVMVDSFFDIFIDEAYDMETATPGSYTYGAGVGPVCLVAAPGATTVAAAMADSRTFAICAGGLGGATGTPATPPTGEVILAKLSGAPGATATVTANAIRGGAVVFKSGAEVTVNGLPLAITIPASTDPLCWSYPCHSKGDVNGDGVLTYADDVQPLINAWGVSYDPCVDFNHDGVLTYTGDVQVLIENWGTTLVCE
ncbi:MAG: hypothetical protein K9M57_03965 [Phycisphaerae bacterium]|nr:hypothetical protein [Phycisphaerae bacterium]